MILVDKVDEINDNMSLNDTCSTDNDTLEKLTFTKSGIRRVKRGFKVSFQRKDAFLEIA